MPGEDIRNSQTNRESAAALQAALARLIRQACTKGVFGEFSLIFKTSDGTIQTEFREVVSLATKIDHAEPG
jgi:hypothetical protein